MEIIRPVFSDKNAAVRICYAGVKPTDGPTLYHNKDCSMPLKPEEVLDAYLKGVVICDTLDDLMETYYTPVGYVRKPTYSSLITVMSNDEEPKLAHIVEFKSEKIQLPG